MLPGGLFMIAIEELAKIQSDDEKKQLCILDGGSSEIVHNEK